MVNEEIALKGVIAHEDIKALIDNTGANWSLDKLCLDLDYLFNFTIAYVSDMFGNNIGYDKKDYDYFVEDVASAFTKVSVYSVLDDYYKPMLHDELYDVVCDMLMEEHSIVLSHDVDLEKLKDYFNNSRFLVRKHMRLYLKDEINLAYSDMSMIYNPLVTPYIVTDVWMTPKHTSCFLELYIVNNKG